MTPTIVARGECFQRALLPHPAPLCTTLVPESYEMKKKKWNCCQLFSLNTDSFERYSISTRQISIYRNFPASSFVFRILFLSYKVKGFNFARYKIMRSCQKGVSLLAWWCFICVTEVCVRVGVAVRVVWDVKIVSTAKRGAITIASVHTVGSASYTSMGQFKWFDVDLVC